MNKKKAGAVNEMRFGVRLVSTTAFALLAAITGALMMVGCPQTPAPGTSFRDCSNGCPEMVVVQQGTFTMGAPAGEEARENLPDQRRGRSVPQHLVTIRHKLAIAKFDVTRDEYAQFVAETNRPYPDSCDTLNASGTFIATNGNWHSPGFPQTGRDPVVCVSWDDAQAYVAWLSAKTGHVYRLLARLSGNTRRARERRRRVTVAIIRRSSAGTSMLVIWIIVSSILAIAG